MPSTDDDEFSAFVVEHEGSLLRTAYLLTGDRGHAEDLVQTALAKAYRHWSRVRTAERPLPYVRTLMVNTHVSWRRRLMSTEQVVEVVPERAGVDPQAAHAVEDEVRRALAGLSPRVRAVLVLRFFEDLTEPQTAAVLGCSVSTVNTHARRGLTALRTALAPAVDPAPQLTSLDRRQP
ncbi:SigE family RNA polymerase sigma factor [Candidatus Blastococcus massiliensis]|uniref:SigE family RNA polymerase sigma factor n=1 Tax=Candidatus Blastococcus massiliensis TaxID=1470358 RepID=UPI0004BCDA51|nr:SigE family RNA polymerase sigma factor [Candidatus Blastococcus massiliensis]